MLLTLDEGESPIGWFLWFEIVCSPNSLLATSAIDCETDTVIQNSLCANLGSGVTPFVIAHRLQTIMGADKIANGVTDL